VPSARYQDFTGNSWGNIPGATFLGHQLRAHISSGESACDWQIHPAHRYPVRARRKRDLLRGTCHTFVRVRTIASVSRFNMRQMNDHASNAPALEGLLVADFSRVLAGPLASMMLADLGARVIKIERPGSGDDTRHWGPPWTESSSAYFESVNRSKESIALDLGSPRDLAVARAIIERADVVIENFMTGTMKRLGLAYADLAAVNPGVIYCSITGFGSGAGRQLPGYDFVVQAASGLMSITGEAGGDPQKVGVALVDVMTGKDAVIGILGALAERARSGRGQRVQINLMSSALASLVNQSSSALATGQSPTRKGNAHPSIAPYETLQCRDGLLVVSCGNDRQFAAMCEVLGIAVEERFATNPQRVAGRPHLRVLLESALTHDDVSAWAAKLMEVGVPAGPINTITDAIAYADSLGLQPTVAVGPDHPRQVSSPIQLSRSTKPNPTPPPELGEHGDAIRQWLAVAPEDPIRE
jgi:crotonobetainyl-CoA:carnitine CoA-transferase CaiB-like acyl-CoA transferase